MAYRPHWFTRRYRLLFIYMSLTSHSIFLCLRTSICTCEYVDSNIRSSRFTCAVCMRILIPTPAPGLTPDVVGFMNQVLPSPERCIAESKSYAPRWRICSGLYCGGAVEQRCERSELICIDSLSSHIIFLCLRTSIYAHANEYVDSNIRWGRFTCADCIRIRIATPAPGFTPDVLGFMNEVMPSPERWIGESK